MFIRLCLLDYIVAKKIKLILILELFKCLKTGKTYVAWTEEFKLVTLLQSV